MSIVTKTGDHGITSLMYGRRVSKADARIEAYGTVDELSAALGMARAVSRSTPVAPKLEEIQKRLIPLMGDLATAPEDGARYGREGYSSFKPEFTAELDDAIKQIESAGVSFKGWALPGETTTGAALDMARTVCRRAERAVCGLMEAGDKRYADILVFLNRLSDLLWLMARQADRDSG